MSKASLLEFREKVINEGIKIHGNINVNEGEVVECIKGVITEAGDNIKGKVFQILEILVESQNGNGLGFSKRIKLDCYPNETFNPKKFRKKNHVNETEESQDEIKKKLYSIYEEVDEYYKDDFKKLMIKAIETKNYGIQDENGNTLMHLALRNESDTYIAQLLFYIYPGFVKIHNKYNITPLYICCRDKIDYWFTLHIAKIYPEAIRLRDTTKQAISPFFIVFSTFSKEMRSTLFPRFFELCPEAIYNSSNRDGRNMLHQTCHIGNIEEIINFVKACPVALNITDFEGVTPLQILIDKKNKEAILFIYENNFFLDSDREVIESFLQK